MNTLLIAPLIALLTPIAIAAGGTIWLRGRFAIMRQRRKLVTEHQFLLAFDTDDERAVASVIRSWLCTEWLHVDDFPVLPRDSLLFQYAIDFEDDNILANLVLASGRALRADADWSSLCDGPIGDLVKWIAALPPSEGRLGGQ